MISYNREDTTEYLRIKNRNYEVTVKGFCNNLYLHRVILSSCGHILCIAHFSGEVPTLEVFRRESIIKIFALQLARKLNCTFTIKEAF